MIRINWRKWNRIEGRLGFFWRRIYSDRDLARRLQVPPSIIKRWRREGAPAIFKKWFK